MRLNFRTIGKLGFLLVIIGFFQPICCDQNGFQLANSDMVKSSLTIALYALFVCAIIGLIIGVLLMINKNMPVIIDWVIFAICFCCGIIPFFINIKKYDWQSGLYIIFAGYVIVFIAQIISAIKKEE